MKQLSILHLSDLHFGKHHRCAPADAGDARAGYPPLQDLILRDLDDERWDGEIWGPQEGDPDPLVVMVTGDLTEGAQHGEFKGARDFLEHLAQARALGRRIGKENLFAVPGNHDVVYDERDPAARLEPYCAFYGQLFRGVRPPVLPDEAENLTQVHDRSDEGLVVAEINSCLYVEKGTPDEKRGNVDMRAIRRLREQLAGIPGPALHGSVRVALLHHHPVLFPALLEPGRGYDAVANSHQLLKLLREFGFQVILHGHKHYPHVLTYDPDSAWAEQEAPAMVIAAGGSAGSRQLPAGGRACNSYNLIAVKWHPEAGMGRVRVVTRGLVATDGAGELAPDQWTWLTLRTVDRVLLHTGRGALRGAFTLVPRAEYWNGQPNAERDDAEEARKQQYGATRLNMVMSEVLPSLRPGQAFQVRVWLVPHADANGAPKPGWVPPVRVRWSAGPMFPTLECVPEPGAAAAAPMFAAAFDYWGPMAVQAQMSFEDGRVAYGYTYAGFPSGRAPARLEERPPAKA